MTSPSPAAAAPPWPLSAATCEPRVAREIEILESPALAARHGFFTRAGGVSAGAYAALQCGAGAKADPLENVLENRARVARALGQAPDRLVGVYQRHSAKAVAVDAPWPRADAPRADGLATATPGIVLSVLAADCAPVLFHDPRARVVGACHAGWRGALDGVLEATLDVMSALGAERARTVAVVGPCIGRDAYEVGPEYVARFTAADPANARFFRPLPEAWPQRDPAKALFDLPGYVTDRLGAAGVASAAALGPCTYSDPDRFFSNRRALHRGEPDYGRLISAIVLEP